MQLLEMAFLVVVALAGGVVGFWGHRWLGFEAHAAALTAPTTRVGAALVTAVLCVAMVWRFGVTSDAIAYALLAVVGVQVSIIDLKYRLLPNRIVLPAAVAGIVALALTAATDGRWERLGGALLGAATLFAVYLLLAIISPSGLGMGDVKLALLVGLFLGYQGWPLLFLGTLLAFMTAAVVAVALIAARRGNRHTAIPFGPFMLAGAEIAILFAQPLTSVLLPSL